MINGGNGAAQAGAPTSVGLARTSRLKPVHQQGPRSHAFRFSSHTPATPPAATRLKVESRPLVTVRRLCYSFYLQGHAGIRLTLRFVFRCVIRLFSSVYKVCSRKARAYFAGTESFSFLFSKFAIPGSVAECAGTGEREF